MMARFVVGPNESFAASLTPWLLAALVFSGCGPGTRVAIEEIARGEVAGGGTSPYGNYCTSVFSMLVWDDAFLAIALEYYIPGATIPEVSFVDRIALLSFSQGCSVDNNELYLDEVRVDDYRLFIFETLVVSDTGIEETTRPYNLSYIDVPWDEYLMEVDVNVVWPG